MAFTRGWTSCAAAPRQMLIDLGSGFKGTFLEMASEENIVARSLAGQAHWQNSMAERHGGVWKSIYRRGGHNEPRLRGAISAVNKAKNNLRNRNGFSPRLCQSQALRYSAKVALFSLSKHYTTNPDSVLKTISLGTWPTSTGSTVRQRWWAERQATTGWLQVDGVIWWRRSTCGQQNTGVSELLQIKLAIKEAQKLLDEEA